MPTPPGRMRLTDELGTPKTPHAGHDTVRLSQGRDWLVLGLGPDPAALAGRMPSGARVRYMECPAFSDQAGRDWRDAIPRGWERVESFDPEADATIILYKGGLRLFPGFWGPALAALALPRPGELNQLPARTALFPATKNRLLYRELATELAGNGFTNLVAPWDGLASVLRQGRPDLYLSVNFAGLDEFGQAQSLLRRAGVPVAVWLVDNPFHALSGQKNRFWQDMHLFVTDSWFIRPLMEYGARRVHHLPLAASQNFFKARPDAPSLADKLLFVGRSGFPGRDGFFGGLKPPKDAWAEAEAMLGRGQRPDFEWWVKRTGTDRLWPGKQVRLAGLGAEESGRKWRSMVITEAARAGKLAVCGDQAWRELSDADFDLLPPVDYYGPLAGMYASARCVVGATSPLLPHGLTQRHFDVWAAGGLLATDNTPGLSIFPEDLTRPVTYGRPSELLTVIHSMEAGRAALTAAWRDLISREHTYARRIGTILEAISS
ncbi:MAG: glycosyltransferase family protein [Thermodesulfobacteriota bacterium]